MYAMYVCYIYMYRILLSNIYSPGPFPTGTSICTSNIHQKYKSTLPTARTAGTVPSLRDDKREKQEYIYIYWDGAMNGRSSTLVGHRNKRNLRGAGEEGVKFSPG